MTEYTSFCYVVIALSVLILCHSIYLERFKFSLVRLLTDICAVGNLLGAIAVLLYSQSQNRETFSIWITIVNNGVAGFMVQLPDTAIYLLGYANVRKKIPLWHWALIAIYLFILYCCWLPNNIFLPFILNFNSKDWGDNYGTPISWYFSVATVVYQLFFTSHFLHIIYKVNFERKFRIQKQAQIFVIKCAIHFVNSFMAGVITFAIPIPIFVSGIVVLRPCLV